MAVRQDTLEGGGAVYKHILVPLDGSALAEQALPYAQLLAARLGARLTLLRAVDSDVTALALPGHYGEVRDLVMRLSAEAHDYSEQGPGFSANGIRASKDQCAEWRCTCLHPRASGR